VTSINHVVPGAGLGRSQDTSVTNSRRPEPNSAPRQQRHAVQHRGLGFRQSVEPQRLQVDRPFSAP
jgi:hypothetical protein